MEKSKKDFIMAEQMIMGNEAIALGALKAGVNLVAGYPGTPSSDIIEVIAKYKNKTGTYVEWSVNEKAAVEVAAAASYAGSRTLVTMKQVGLNVASDPVMCLSYVGVKGGMVIVSADDPGPISSQTEQDTRKFGSYSKIPVLDPSTPKEAFEMIQEAFELSEKYNTPVFLRPTTRVDHAYESMEMPELTKCRDNGKFEKDSQRWVIFPRASFMNHKRIFNRNEKILPEEFSKSKWNRIDNENNTYGNTGEYSSQNGNTGAGSATCSGCCAFASGGISYQYLKEAVEILGKENPSLKAAPILKIGTPYPFPENLAVEFLKSHNEVTVFEELDPVIEEALIFVSGKYNINCKIHGKLDGTVPEAGELSVEVVKKVLVTSSLSRGLSEDSSTSLGMTNSSLGMTKESLGMTNSSVTSTESSVTSSLSRGLSEDSSTSLGMTKESLGITGASVTSSLSRGLLPTPELPVRPPVLCAGCPHRGSFYAVKVAMKGQKTVYCGDIGCYTLGNAKPLDMCDTCLCMGADVTMAQGFYHNEPDTKCFSFIGDSTFFASGITGTVNAVYNKAKMTLCILDNSTTAMTGHQPHPGTGVTMMGEMTEKISIPKILEAIGVSPIIEVNPFNLSEAVEAVKKASDSDGVSAVIFKSPCIAVAGKLGYPKPVAKKVDNEKCIGCQKCIRELGCPALSIKAGEKKVEIDSATCTGCGLCANICPAGAIN